MAFPKINIIFKSVGASVVKRGDRGIVYVILKDAAAQAGIYKMNTVADVPADLSDYNKKQLGLVFRGGVNAPKQVIAYVQDTATANYNDALKYAETVKFNYLVVPGISQADADTVGAAVKGMRDSLGRKVKAVLPKMAGDSDAVVNFTTDNIEVGEETFATKDYASRIAGILAGTPLVTSATFQVLPEVTGVPRLTEAEAGTKIAAGELILFHDGEKVKIARGVNSLVTTTQDKGDQFKKIKIVDTLDMIHDDIKRTAEDNYIGKVPNSYENKLLLINAINAYFEQLEVEGILDRGKNKCQIDVQAQASYLKVIGMNADEMSEAEIKAANTRDKVFLTAVVKPLDAMEDIALVISL